MVNVLFYVFPRLAVKQVAIQQKIRELERIMAINELKIEKSIYEKYWEHRFKFLREHDSEDFLKKLMMGRYCEFRLGYLEGQEFGDFLKVVTIWRKYRPGKGWISEYT